MSLRIGFSFWGFLEKPERSSVVDTPDGLRGERYLLVDELLRRGHKVICLQQMRESEPYPGVEYDSGCVDPVIDVLFLEWRWPNKSATNGPDIPRQNTLLKSCAKHGIPTVCQDTDLKVTLYDEQLWPRMVIGDPSLDPHTQRRRRIKMPFCTDFKMLYEPSERSCEYMYLGNRYERDAQFKQYYSLPAYDLRLAGIQTTVHGNWLNRSAERSDPSELIAKHRFVSFCPRLSYREGMQRLNRAICTTHIGKDRYARYGNVTMRVFEAIQCGVPALIPWEHKHLLPLARRYWAVDKPIDVVERVKKLRLFSAAERAEVVEEQKEELQRLGDFSPGHKADIIEGVARRDVQA